MPTATPFNNLITFSRGSNATVTGSNGLIQYAPNNLITHSEQLDNAAWVKTNTTIIANSAIAPDGTQTADNMIASVGNNAKFVSQSSLPSTIGAFTVYAKPAGETVISLWLVGASVGASFTLTGDGTTALLGATSSSITPVGNGWYRCAVYHNTATTTAHIYLRTGSSFIGDGTSGVLIWGTQLEIGSAATAYNSTTVKNPLGFSEAFDNAAWTKLRASIVTGAQANPVNGLFNAQKLMEDTTASNTHLISQGPTLTAAPNVLSVYVKAAGRNWFALVNNSIANVSAFFDLANGVVGTVGSAATASITNVGSGWYRCSMAFTAIAATNNLHFRLASANGVDSYTGDGNSGVYIYGAQLSDSASLDPYVPTPGAAPSSTAYYGPRFDFDPVTLLPRGLLVEEQRTNLLLNSLITGANLSTQNVTVTAVAHTISFYGTGSITLSGAHSATVNGTGAYPTRTTLTFTPTAGTLTCTVSGTVQFANLEVGAFATSYIPTIASTVTRSADVATISGSLFSQWYRQDEGVIAVDTSTFKPTTLVGSVIIAEANDNTLNNRNVLFYTNADVRGRTAVAGVTQAEISQAYVANATDKLAYAYRVNDFAFARNGGLVGTDTTGTIPVADRFMIGGFVASASLNGHIRNIRFIPARAADFQLQALST